MKDYYYLLGLDVNASANDIKKAYRKLSIKFHPDKNDGDKYFEERFKDIHEAYSILSDEEKRRKHDESKNSGSKKSKQARGPKIVKFIVSPTTCYVGDTISISWNVVDSESVNLSLFGDVESKGSRSIKIKKESSGLPMILKAKGAGISIESSKTLVIKNNNTSKNKMDGLYEFIFFTLISVFFLFLIMIYIDSWNAADKNRKLDEISENVTKNTNFGYSNYLEQYPELNEFFSSEVSPNLFKLKKEIWEEEPFYNDYDVRSSYNNHPIISSDGNIYSEIREKALNINVGNRNYVVFKLAIIARYIIKNYPGTYVRYYHGISGYIAIDNLGNVVPDIFFKRSDIGFGIDGLQDIDDHLIEVIVHLAKRNEELIDKIVFSNENEIESYQSYEYSYLVHNSKGYGFVDEKGKQKIPFMYDEAGPFVNGFSKVSLNGEVFFINSDNNRTITLPRDYDSIDNYSEGGYVRVKKDDLYGIVDLSGKEIIKTIHDYLYERNNHFIAAKHDLYGLYGPKGNLLIPFKFEYIEIEDEEIFVAIEGELGYGTLTGYGWSGSGITFDLSMNCISGCEYINFE